MKLPVRITAVAALIFVALFAHLSAYALTVEYELTIAQQKINITGNPASGMTINGAIPGPTLHFKEGDTARIHVHNKMSVETSIHRQCD
jgi:FtsP/CotA-like multicopper oxidase with cupredoxin domain